MPSPVDASTSKTPSPPPEVEKDEKASNITFKSLGLIDPLLDALSTMNFTNPTEIQQESLPHALEGRDIIGVAATGSGKTAAFALPILQKLWEEPKGLFACVLAPTRELAYQISQQFEALGASMGARCAVWTCLLRLLPWPRGRTSLSLPLVGCCSIWRRPRGSVYEPSSSWCVWGVFFRSLLTYI